MWAHKDTKQASMLNTIFMTLSHHPSYQVWWPYAFCGSGNMFLVCSVALSCNQREVWVDVGYWTMFCVSDG